MRWLLVVLAALTLQACSEAEASARRCREGRLGRLTGCDPSTAVASGYVPTPTSSFSFAPVAGTGMGAACACTNPTAADGTAVTFTRASSGYCTKGNWLTGIANGDLVKCANNQARVMPGGDDGGTWLGVLNEADHTTVLKDDSDFSSGNWTLEHVVQPVPTVTANAGVAPDGTSNADRIQFPATGAAEDSAIRQDTGTSGTHSAGVYIRGYITDGGTSSGTVDFATYNGSAWECTPCTYTSASWTRCVHENYTTDNYWLLGNAGFRCGNARSDNDVLVWGGDFQSGTKLMSHIDNGSSASVTYVADNLTVPVTTVGSIVDVSAAVETESTFTNSAGAFSLEFASSDSWVRAWLPAGVNPNQRCTFRYMGSDTNKDGATAWLANSFVTTRCFRDNTTYNTCVRGTCATTTAQLLVESGSATLYMGQAGGERVGGVVKGVVVTSTQGSSTAWVGDSLSTVTYGDAPGKYAADATRTVNNYAVGGEGFSFAGPQIQSQWLSHNYTTNTRVVVEGGINDIRNDVTGASLATTVQTFLGTLTADSRTVIFLNLAPFGNNASWTSGRQTQLAAYNSAMATWCGTHPAVTCVDTYTLMSAGGGSPQNLNAAYDSGDGLHWNSTGAQAVADQVFAQAP